MYKIGYIKGYDRFNTIRFSTLSEQQTYFDNHVLSNNHIVPAYYPPHYTNKIKIDIRERTLDGANFVTIVYDNKYYYYFIDNVTYINENIMVIDITMDTIQTYMFDVKINYGELDRLSIPRWKRENNVDVINRNYIRENLSVGNFINSSVNVYGEYNFMVIIRNKYSNEDEKVLTRIQRPDGTIITTGIVIELMLMPNSDMTYAVQGDPTDLRRWTLEYPSEPNEVFDMDNYTYNDIVNKLLISSQVHNIYILNSRIVSDLFTISIATVDNEKHTTITPDASILSATYGNSIVLKLITSKIFYHTHTIQINGNSFSRNDSQNNFDLSYIPQLIDENYMNIAYGERKAYAKYPLYKLTDTDIQLEEYYDFYEGIRGYHIRQSLQPNVDGVDKYDTWAINSLPISFNLINNAWANYTASHKASLTQGRDLAYDELTANMGFKMLSAGLTSAELSLDSRKDSSLPLVGGLLAPLQNIISTKALKTKYKVQDEDLKNTPNTIGQGASLISDLINGCNRTTLKVDIVNDIEQVARYFETYGYKVKKYVSNIELKQLPNNRYYFNYYKFDDVSLYITSSLVTTAIIGDIIERLTNGLRMFENKPNELVIDYTKDNYDITYEN